MLAFLTGIAVVIAILTRPVGRSLSGVLIFLPIFESSERRSWPNWFCGIGGARALLLSFSLWNYSHHGFFGLDQMGGISLYCTVTILFLTIGLHAFLSSMVAGQDPGFVVPVLPLYYSHRGIQCVGINIYPSLNNT